MAPLIEDLRLARVLVWLTECIPHLRVLCYQPQRDLFATATDQDRHRSCRTRFQLLDALFDSRQRILQRAQPVSGLTEFESELLVVTLEPPSAEPEHEPATGKLVDGAGHVGDEVWAAISDRGDHRA